MHTLTSLRAFARLLFRSCCLLSLLVAPVMQAQSQSSGEVTGTVRNSATGAFLGGAEVRIVGTALVTLTQRDGSFSLGNVPAGSQRVRVFYTGLDPQEATVQVAASAVGFNANISLKTTGNKQSISMRADNLFRVANISLSK